MKTIFLLLITLAIAVAYPGGYDAGGNYEGDGGGYSDGGSTGYMYHQQGKNYYDFGYDVSDPYYGSHSRKEKKENGYVTGSYSYQDKDGNTVVVDYEADPKNGYRATVKDKNGVKQYGYDSYGDEGKYDDGGHAYETTYGQGGGGDDQYY